MPIVVWLFYEFLKHLFKKNFLLGHYTLETRPVRLHLSTTSQNITFTDCEYTYMARPLQKSGML